jgi:hypothetical protein
MGIQASRWTFLHFRGSVFRPGSLVSVDARRLALVRTRRERQPLFRGPVLRLSQRQVKSQSETSPN